MWLLASQRRDPEVIRILITNHFVWLPILWSSCLSQSFGPTRLLGLYSKSSLRSKLTVVNKWSLHSLPLDVLLIITRALLLPPQPTLCSLFLACILLLSIQQEHPSGPFGYESASLTRLSDLLHTVTFEESSIQAHVPTISFSCWAWFEFFDTSSEQRYSLTLVE